MFVEFIKALPGSTYVVGNVVDVADSIARSYIETGYAKESSAADHLAAISRGAMDAFKTEITGVLRDAVKAVATPPADRGVAVGDGFNAVGRTGADRINKMTLGDLTRAMYWKRAYGEDDRISESQARHANDYIKRFKLEQTRWTDNSEGHVTGDNPHGVARDGSESTAGAPTYGYLVKPEFMTDVFKIEAETDVMTNLRQIPMGAGVEMRVPALDQYGTTTPNRTSNYFGGVQLYRRTEDAARIAVDAKVSEIIFKATDLTGLTKVSRDLLADSFIDINGFLQGLFKDAFGWRRDWDFLNGTGVGEPQGIFGCACELTVTRATASHIRYEDIAGMLAKIMPQAQRGAYWICNAQAAIDLQSVLAASPSAFAFQPNSAVSQSQYPAIYGTSDFQGVLFGLPIKYTEKVPTLGTARDLTLFSPKYYGEANKAGIEVGLSEHRYFENDQVAIRWKLRNDGQPMLKGAFKGADGNSYSPIITLL